MYFAIATSQSWDAIIPCSSKVREELQFWDKNVGQLNGKKLFDEPHVLIPWFIHMHQSRALAVT